MLMHHSDRESGLEVPLVRQRMLAAVQRTFTSSTAGQASHQFHSAGPARGLLRAAGQLIKADFQSANITVMLGPSAANMAPLVQSQELLMKVNVLLLNSCDFCGLLSCLRLLI